MIAAACALLCLQWAVSDPFVTPAHAKQFSPVEISFSINGFAGNPFNPAEINVDAVVEGPGGIGAELPGYFSIVNGTPIWHVRFAPWSGGTFTVNITVIGDKAPISLKKFSLKVESDKGAEKTGVFLESRLGQQFWTLGDHSFFGCGPEIQRTATLENALQQLNLASKLGANFALLPLSGAFAIWSEGYKVDLGAAANLERFLKEAESKNIYVMLAAEPQKTGSWEDFWDALKPRIEYKGMLAYIIARYNSMRSFGGLMLTRNVQAPFYWLDEMAKETYVLHIYGIPITAKSVIADADKVQHLNTLLTDVLPDKKALMTVADNLSDTLSALASGASAVIAGKEFSYGAAPALGNEINLKGRKLARRDVLDEDIIGKALLDAKGGMAFISQAGHSKAAIQFPSGGKYLFDWYDANASLVGTSEVRATKDSTEISLPASTPLFAIIRK